MINWSYCIRLILVILCLPSFSQMSQGRRFSSDVTKGCTPLTINLTVLDTFGGITRQYFYENEHTVTTSQTHTYDVPGIYHLVQLVGIDIEPKTDTLVIEVLAPIAPIYDYFFCGGREVYLEINDPTYDAYKVLFANNQQVTLSNGEHTTYVFGLTERLSINVQGIYSNAEDNCATSSTVLNQVFDHLIAPDIRSMELVQSCEDLFNLTVSTVVEPGILYQIEVSQNGGAYTSIYDGFLTSPIILENIAIDRHTTEYYVRINTKSFCKGSVATGNPSGQTLEKGDLNPVRNLYSSYSGNQIQLFLDSVSIGSFLFRRSFDQNSFSTVGQGSTSITDKNTFFGRQYFYQVSYQDTCNTVWGQQATSPPFIRAQENSTNNYQITFDPAVHDTGESFTYQARLSGNGLTTVIPITENTLELSLGANLGENQTLQIIGISPNFIVRSNTLNFLFEFIAYVPKAFTPNGDGLNDQLAFFGLDDRIAIVRIYTRWGQQIYEDTSSAPAWDGFIGGHLADEGIYVYEISIPSLTNHVQKGTFVLLTN